MPAIGPGFKRDPNLFRLKPSLRRIACQVMLSPVFMLVLAEAEKGAFWYFKQMDSAGMAVAVVLGICSFIGWGAMIQKWSDIHELRRRNHAFERRLRDEPSVVALNFPRGSNLGPYEFLVAEAVSAVQRHKGRLARPADVTLCMGHVENAVQRGVARTMVKYEDKMVLLSSLVSGGPFLGLLGTVWGVMVTFGALTHALPTCHGNGIVVQNFVGDIHTRSNALANSQNTAVKISAVTDVGKHMFFMAEVLLANPGRAFAAHLGKAHGAAVHPNTHEMATNAGHGPRVRHQSRRRTSIASGAPSKQAANCSINASRELST